MNTYKFIMLRVYETDLEYTAETLEQAKEMLENDDNRLYKEMEQCSTTESYYLVDDSKDEIKLNYTISGVKPI